MAFCRSFRIHPILSRPTAATPARRRSGDEIQIAASSVQLIASTEARRERGGSAMTDSMAERTTRRSAGDAERLGSPWAWRNARWACLCCVRGGRGDENELHGHIARGNLIIIEQDALRKREKQEWPFAEVSESVLYLDLS